MKEVYRKAADQPEAYIELDDQEVTNVLGGQGIGQWLGEEDLRDSDRCYYDQKHRRRYCVDRHGHRYEPHEQHNKRH